MTVYVKDSLKYLWDVRKSLYEDKDVLQFEAVNWINKEGKNILCREIWYKGAMSRRPEGRTNSIIKKEEHGGK